MYVSIKYVDHDLIIHGLKLMLRFHLILFRQTESFS